MENAFFKKTIHGPYVIVSVITGVILLRAPLKIQNPS
jgi:hypothetical protein